MRRTFQGKPNIRQYVLLAVLLSVVVFLFWIPIPRAVLGILTFVLLFCAAKLASQITGTTYTIHSDGYMELHFGKVTTPVSIRLDDIKQIDKMRRHGTIIIVMNNGKEYYLLPPRNEEDFIKCIEKYRSKQ